MAEIELKGLYRFREKIDNLLKIKENDELKERIAKIGEEEFRNALSGDSELTGIEISSKIEKNKVIIYAKDLKDDVDIAFYEFGTGFSPITYEGKLPTKTISFVTETGRFGQTAGWEYYYDSPAKRDRPSLGGYGWYLPKVKGGYFDRGMDSHNTFYHACQEIKRRIKEELSIDDL